MATALTHAVVAAAATAVCFRRRPSAKLWLLAVACSAGPDLDVGLRALGVQYGEPWGHRGMTHSLAFALILSLALVTLLFRREAAVLSRRWFALIGFFFFLTASHGFVDAFTDGGLGIAFFAPFDHTRTFMPWTPLRVPAFGLTSLFTGYGMEVLLSEFVWVWLPLGGVTAMVLVFRSGADEDRDPPRRQPRRHAGGDRTHESGPCDPESHVRALNGDRKRGGERSAGNGAAP